VARLSITRTPKPGYHVRYRCHEIDVPGITKLAIDLGTKVVLIEKRGEGGYALAPGCPAKCHHTGRLYVHHSGPPLEKVQAIGIELREVLIRCAMSFDRVPPPEPLNPKKNRGPGLSPGDDFDQRGPDWPAILEPHGWQQVHERDGLRYWRRAGKDGPCWSATTGVCSKAGRPLFCVFSTNAAPFPGPVGGRNCSTHGKFATYTLLNCGGDFSAAARELAEKGYGEQQAGHRQAPEPLENGKAAVPQVEDIHLTDLGNARRVVKRHGSDLRYVHPWKTWLVWDGKRWAEDVTGEVVRRVKDTLADLYRSVLARIKELGDDEEAVAEKNRLGKLVNHALKWEDARGLSPGPWNWPGRSEAYPPSQRNSTLTRFC
jgi:D5 N terminal like